MRPDPLGPKHQTHGFHSPHPDPMADELARLESANAELVAALKRLLDRDMKNTCTHEETHRGGFLWEICDQCGAKWADDEGGRPEFQEPDEWSKALSALANTGKE